MDGSSVRKMTVSGLFARLGQLFIQGRLFEMTEHWSFPCPVEVNGSLEVMLDASALEGFFSVRRAAAMEAGMTAYEPCIIAIEMPRSGRFRVWLRWAQTFGDVRLIEEPISLYYMARGSWGALTIEMMDIVIVPEDLAASA